MAGAVDAGPGRLPRALLAARARQRIAAALDERHAYAGVRGLEPVAVWGPPDAVVKGPREVVPRL